MKKNNRIISKVCGKEGFDELERIRAKNNGKLSPDIVVNEASNEASPLHEYFQWDDLVAAMEYRQEQARTLIRSVVVWSEDDKQDNRFYTSVVVGSDKRPSYIPLTVALSRSDTREQVLREAIGELQSFRRKYEYVEKLKKVIVAIDQTEAEVGSQGAERSV